MSDLELHPLPAGSFVTAATFLSRAFAESPPDYLATAEPLFEIDRSLGAYLGDELVGTTWIESLRMVLPGSVTPVAGVTGVGVSPVHRRRGILSAIMRRQLNDIHERGTEPVAALWASEPAIYGRFGYGMAAPLAHIRGERAHLRFPGAAPDVRLRIGDPDPALLAPVHTAALTAPGGARAGTPVRTADRWAFRLTDTPGRREGAGPLVSVMAEGPDGGAEGYVLYRTTEERGETGPAGTVAVLELVATTVRARRALWRYVATLDLTASFEAWVPVDDPLFHLVDDPRRLSFRLRDGLFIRIIDLPAAVAARSYAASASMTLEVTDEICPWNAGRWAVELSPDGASCVRTSAPADLTLSTTELGAAYLGGPRLTTLALAGRVDELRSGALAELSRAFVCDFAPYCLEVF